MRSKIHRVMWGRKEHPATVFVPFGAPNTMCGVAAAPFEHARRFRRDSGLFHAAEHYPGRIPGRLFHFQAARRRICHNS